MDGQSFADVQTFSEAHRLVQAEGLDVEYLRHEAPDNLHESTLLREFAWVVLSSGFREKIVRRIFSNISLCFFDWSSSKEINESRDICILSALDVFKFRRKIVAIADGAKIIAERNFEEFRDAIQRDALFTLRSLPFVGPVTVFHLAKNIGFSYAKPDRHLVRLSERHGYDDTNQFCSAVSRLTGLPVPHVDTVLWRLSEMGQSDVFFLPSIAEERRRAS